MVLPWFSVLFYELFCQIDSFLFHTLLLNHIFLFPKYFHVCFWASVGGLMKSVHIHNENPLIYYPTIPWKLPCPCSYHNINMNPCFSWKYLISYQNILNFVGYVMIFSRPLFQMSKKFQLIFLSRYLVTNWIHAKKSESLLQVQ